MFFYLIMYARKIVFVSSKLLIIYYSICIMYMLVCVQCSLKVNVCLPPFYTRWCADSLHRCFLYLIKSRNICSNIFYLTSLLYKDIITEYIYTASVPHILQDEYMLEANFKKIIFIINLTCHAPLYTCTIFTWSLYRILYRLEWLYFSKLNMCEYVCM